MPRPALRRTITKRTSVILLLLIVAGAIINVAVAWGCALRSMNESSYWGYPTTRIEYGTPPLIVSGPGVWTVAKDASSFGLRLRVYARVDAQALLQDFVHYALIANPAMSAALGASAVTFVGDQQLRQYLRNDAQRKRLRQALERAEMMPSVKPIARRMSERIGGLGDPMDASFEEDSLPSPASNDAISVIDAGWPAKTVTGSECETVSAGSTIPSSQMMSAWRVRAPTSRGPSGTSRLIPFGPIWPGFATNTLFYAVILGGLFAVLFALRRRRRIKRGLCPKCAYPIGTSDVCTECGGSVSPRAS